MLLQPLKANSPIDVQFERFIIPLREEQRWNAWSPIVVHFDKSTFESFSQYWNAFLPIEVQFEISIFSSFLQLRNI